VALDDFEYPHRLGEIYDPSLVLYLAGSQEVINSMDLTSLARAIRPRMGWELRSG
jgi:hypothetical protein